MHQRPPQRRAKRRAEHAPAAPSDEGAVGGADWGRDSNFSLFQKRKVIEISPSGLSLTLQSTSLVRGRLFFVRYRRACVVSRPKAPLLKGAEQIII